jgi:hypothetical protein
MKKRTWRKVDSFNLMTLLELTLSPPTIINKCIPTITKMKFYSLKLCSNLIFHYISNLNKILTIMKTMKMKMTMRTKMMNFLTMLRKKILMT